MIYFLNIAYMPDMASTNRLLGYYAALEKMKVSATVVYLLPDRGKHIHDDSNYGHIHVEHYWQRQTWQRNLPNNVLTRWCRFNINLHRFVRQLKPGDVVYTYHPHKATRAVLKKHGVACFSEVTEHPDVSWFMGRVAGLSKAEQIEITKRLDGLFVISSTLKDYYVSLGLNKNRVHVVNMIVDPTRFQHLKKQPTPHRYIAYCGNQSNSKDGVDELIKAFALVASQLPDVRLKIIGKAHDQVDLDTNVKLVENLGITDRVDFTGPIPSHQLPQLLKNADVLALARPDSLQAQHGFPTKLGEYLMTENPVVVTRVGDIPLFLTDGVSALMPKPQDTKAFADKLLWALTHPQEAAMIGQHGKAVAMTHFNNETETSKIIDVLATPSFPL